MTAILLAALLAFSADELCINQMCSEASGAKAIVAAAAAPRLFTWRTAEMTLIGTVAAGQTEVVRPPGDDGLAFQFHLAGHKSREWPADVTVETADGAKIWKWTIPAEDAASVQRVRIPPGRYKLTFRAAHHQPLVYPRLRIDGAKTQDLGLLTLPPALRIIGKVTTAGRPPQAGRCGRRQCRRNAARRNGPHGRFCVRDGCPAAGDCRLALRVRGPARPSEPRRRYCRRRRHSDVERRHAGLCHRSDAAR
jgi:hypothetical protein